MNKTLITEIIRKKKWNAHNDRILKYVKCLWDEMLHINI